MHFHSFSGIVRSGLLMLCGAFLGGKKKKKASFSDFFMFIKKSYKDLIKTSIWTASYGQPGEVLVLHSVLGGNLETWRLIRLCRLPGLEPAELSRFCSAALHCVKLFILSRAKPGWSTAGVISQSVISQGSGDITISPVLYNCFLLITSLTHRPFQLSICLSLLCCLISHFFLPVPPL